jgi:hypothetical protein
LTAFFFLLQEGLKAFQSAKLHVPGDQLADTDGGLAKPHKSNAHTQQDIR